MPLNQQLQLPTTKSLRVDITMVTRATYNPMGLQV